MNRSGSNLDPTPRLDDGGANSRGTRDKPVIVEDDELDTPEPVPKAAAVFVSLGADTDSACELGKGRCYDSEDKCYVDDDLHPNPPLEQERLASTPTLSQSHFHRQPPRSS